MSDADIGLAAVPDDIERLSLRHDEVSETTTSVAESICSDLTETLDRADRHELAAAIDDIRQRLAYLYQEKLDAGWFDGCAVPSVSVRERVAHLKSEHRILLNELRRIQNETASGKLSKSRRLLNAWLRDFADATNRESNLIVELWPFNDSAA